MEAYTLGPGEPYPPPQTPYLFSAIFLFISVVLNFCFWPDRRLGLDLTVLTLSFCCSATQTNLKFLHTHHIHSVVKGEVSNNLLFFKVSRTSRIRKVCFVAKNVLLLLLLDLVMFLGDFR